MKFKWESAVLSQILWSNLLMSDLNPKLELMCRVERNGMKLKWNLGSSFGQRSENSLTAIHRLGVVRTGTVGAIGAILECGWANGLMDQLKSFNSGRTILTVHRVCVVPQCLLINSPSIALVQMEPLVETGHRWQKCLQLGPYATVIRLVVVRESAQLVHSSTGHQLIFERWEAITQSGKASEDFPITSQGSEHGRPRGRAGLAVERVGHAEDGQLQWEWVRYGRLHFGPLRCVVVQVDDVDQFLFGRLHQLVDLGGFFLLLLSF